VTRLLSDLTAIASLHGHQHADAVVLVPIGMVRAAVTMLGRYEGWPLVDRPLHPEFVDMATTPRRGGGKNANVCAGQRRRRERERMDRIHA